MFSKTAEYALRALVYLAAADDEGEGAAAAPEAPRRPPQTVEQIAESTQVPAGYLAKVLQSLTRAGLVASQRGIGGGFRLARAPGAITVYEAVEAVDPIPRIRECPLGLERHSGGRLCPLHRGLDDAMCLIEEQFRATTLAQLVEDPPAMDLSRQVAGAQQSLTVL
jgi:Rrf2 family protein